MKTLSCAALLLLLIHPVLAQQKTTPSFEEVISLQSAGSPQISPDGQHILYEVRKTDWEDNRFDTEVWLARAGEEPFQLTNHPDNSSSNPAWSPDGKWIAFLSERSGKTQLQLIRAAGGEAYQLTHTGQDISDFAWSPDGSQILFTQAEDKSRQEEKEKEQYGSFEVEDEAYTNHQLWIISFDPAVFTSSQLPGDSVQQKARRLLEEADFHVRKFAWSPDGSKIAIEHSPTSQLLDFFQADISVLDTASKKLQLLVDNPSGDALLDWSPDGEAVLYSSDLDNTTSNFYTNSKLFRINVDGSNERQLASAFDENLYSLDWTPAGIYATAYQRTKRPLFKIDPESGEVKELLSSPERIYGLTASKDGKQLALLGSTDKSLPEVYKVSGGGRDVQKITHQTEQIGNWKVSDSEVISWKSRDGTTIEGILHKPADYDPGKQYPLLVAIHGGPTGISLPDPAPSYVYPILQWLDKGALVLMPNYRGSAGYGEAFRSLNVRNLGVGDAWDVLSGIEYLEAQNRIDTDKLGAMGWSQGGYISAFLTTHSDRFKAISVGAGISDWETYYVSTDIHPFTRQYLQATPWDDPEVYDRTSPMSGIKDASTPTLIQHGEFDKRVPISNAYELYQGLQDVGVETKLIVYKGFGHGITKPRERLAAMWHNWQWFGKYIWGEEVELPMAE
jgi:dipeptidyl aminopeptidase/acylaminoacyl peptidase